MKEAARVAAVLRRLEKADTPRKVRSARKALFGALRSLRVAVDKRWPLPSRERPAVKEAKAQQTLAQRVARWKLRQKRRGYLGVARHRVEEFVRRGIPVTWAPGWANDPTAWAPGWAVYADFAYGITKVMALKRGTRGDRAAFLAAERLLGKPDVPDYPVK